MTFASVCSGIEAPSAAWIPLGWRPLWFAEVAKFPSAVLAHHHPEVPNHGDFTRLLAEPPATPDVLIGGTPCQSFSVAGLRGGLTDPRGNLALAFVALVDVLRPRWVVWENVPGVLSSHRGRDFGAFLGALGHIGYGFAYRVLDAQYAGLAQRRKRVFVVASPGDWRGPAAALFEPESLCGDSPPRREAGARTAGSLGCGASGGGGWRVGADEAAGGQVVPVDLQNLRVGGEAAGTLDCSRPGRGGGQAVMAFGGNNTRGPIDTATAVRAKGGTGHGDFESETFVAHSLRAEGFDASEDGTGRGVPLGPVAYQCHGSNVGPMGTLRRGSGSVTGGAPFVAMAFNWQSGGDARGLEPRDTAALTANQHPAVYMPARTLAPDGGVDERYAVRDVCDALHGSSGNGNKAPLVGGVRRLSCTEQERLQGFPDGFTAIPWRGRPASACPDGPRSKALGNSMAVPVIAWIGRRIEAVDAARATMTEAP